MNSNARNDSAIPDTMNAWVLHGPKDLRMETRPVASPLPGSVLVRVGSVGICGSDKHFYQEGRASSDIVSSPIVLGHEFGGTIVAVGEGVPSRRLGERVSIEPLIPDWSSREARSGRYNIDPDQRFFGVPGLDGGLQEYVGVPSGNAHTIPSSVSDDASAMVETISVALNGVEKSGIGLGSTVLVAGGGPVGLFVVQLCRLSGASRVGLVELQDSRRQRGADLGAEVFSDLSGAPGHVDAFIECTGVDSVRHDGFFTVRPGGRVVFIGVGSPSASVPMAAVIEREVTLHGVMRYAFTWPKVIDLIASGVIDADGLVSRTLPFADADLAWSDPQSDEIKTMIKVS